MSPASPFKSPEGEARFLAACDAARKLWPVPHEEIDIPSRFGTTGRQRTDDCATAGTTARIHGDADDVVAQHQRFEQGASCLCHRRHGSAEQEQSKA